MPEAPLPTDPVREEVLRAAAMGLQPMAAALLPRLFAAIPVGELARRSPEALGEAATSLSALAAQRLPGEVKLRLLPPASGRGAHGVAEIVTDDMPFLVDSVLGALTRQGRVVKEFLHPILAMTREDSGALARLGEGPLRESLMRVTIGATAGALLPGMHPGSWEQVEAALRKALADVRDATGDFEAMTALLDKAMVEIADDGESREFLGWLRGENFVVLGHRHFVLEGEGASIVTEENLGLLRDPKVPVFDALANLPAINPRIRAALVDQAPITVAKANMRSTVHRPQHADVVATRIVGPDGKAKGIRLFLGLFAAGAYNRNPRSIPLLRGKVDRILEAAGVAADSHDGRALRNIMDTWPRDELFQATEAEILAAAQLALDLSIRPRPALSIRPDPFGRFVSVIAWLPRESFDSQLRSRVGEMLARAHGGRLSAFYIALGDSPLARIHYIIGTDPARPVTPDHAALEAAVTQLARSFGDRLGEVLAEERGETVASAVMEQWRDAFSGTYQETENASQASADLALAETALASGRTEAAVIAPPGEGARRLELRLAVPGASLALADALPLFDSLDLRAIEEVPYKLAPRSAAEVSLHVFKLDAGCDILPEREPLLIEALEALIAGEIEADGFNRLVLRAGLDWRECWLVRAMYRWVKQVGFPFAQESVAAALAGTPEAARILVDLFHKRFDPSVADRDEAALDAAWTAMLDQVADPDTDRILQRMRKLLDAMLRTNFYQKKAYIAFKLDSALAGAQMAALHGRVVHEDLAPGAR